MKLLLGRNNVTVECRDVQGRLLSRQKRHNWMVEAGRNAVRDLLQGVGEAPLYIAAGQSGAVLGDGTTALGAELFRIACHSRTVMDNKAVFMATFDTATIQGHQAYDVEELGLFANCGWEIVADEALPHDGGTMYCRVRIAPIDLGDVDTINTIFVAWEIPLYAE